MTPDENARQAKLIAALLGLKLGDAWRGTRSRAEGSGIRITEIVRQVRQDEWRQMVIAALRGTLSEWSAEHFAEHARLREHPAWKLGLYEGLVLGLEKLVRREPGDPDLVDRVRAEMEKGLTEHDALWAISGIASGPKPKPIPLKNLKAWRAIQAQYRRAKKTATL